MADAAPYQSRDITDRRAEHISMLEHLEAQMLAAAMSADRVRVRLLEPSDPAV